MAVSALRIGVAGLGFGAQTYVPVVRRLEGAELCALADGGSNKAAELAASLGPSVRSYCDGEAMIDKGELDCVVVATPPAAQTGLVRLALENGLSVLCEKPCGVTLEDCADLTRLAEIAAVPAATGFEYRYEAGIAALIDLVRSGEIGEVRDITVTWRTGGGLNQNRLWSWRDDVALGGGVLNEFCTHVFDYVSLLMNAPIERILCTARTVVTRRPDGVGGMRPAQAPDDVEINATTAAGVLARITVGNIHTENCGHRIEVRGETGAAIFDHPAPFLPGTASLAVDSLNGRVTRKLPMHATWNDLDSRCPAVAEMITDFFDAVRGQTNTRLAKIENCLTARHCIAAAWQSTETGEWVDVEGGLWPSDQGRPGDMEVVGRG